MAVHKLGIIGYGGMGSYHHNKTPKPDNIRYVAACDSSPKRRELAKADGLETYNDPKKLLKNPEIEAVLIATPNNLHFPLAKLALDCGKHVICEKPATLTADEFKILMETARDKNLILTCHQNRRMDEDFLIIKKLVEDGELGEVFRLESRVEGSRGIADTWRRKKEFGGGMLYDWGSHLIDQILLLTKGKVTSVFMRRQQLLPLDADDNFRLELEFDTGLSALIEIGTCNYIMHPLWYAFGRKGSAQIDYWDLSGKVVTLTNENISWEDEIKPNIAGPSITMAPRANDTVAEKPLPRVKVDTGFFYKNFANVLEGTETLCIDPSQTLRVMQIIDLAFASAKQNQVLYCEL